MFWQWRDGMSYWRQNFQVAKLRAEGASWGLKDWRTTALQYTSFDVQITQPNILHVLDTASAL